MCEKVREKIIKSPRVTVCYGIWDNKKEGKVLRLRKQRHTQPHTFKKSEEYLYLLDHFGDHESALLIKHFRQDLQA